VNITKEFHALMFGDMGVASRLRGINCRTLQKLETNWLAPASAQAIASLTNDVQTSDYDMVLHVGDIACSITLNNIAL
jgi:hypothetical protein